MVMPYLESVDHVINYIHIDAADGQIIRKGGGAKENGVALVYPRVYHDGAHLNSTLGVGLEQPMEEVLAIWNINICTCEQESVI